MLNPRDTLEHASGYVPLRALFRDCKIDGLPFLVLARDDRLILLATLQFQDGPVAVKPIPVDEFVAKKMLVRIHIETGSNETPGRSRMPARRVSHGDDDLFLVLD